MAVRSDLLCPNWEGAGEQDRRRDRGIGPVRLGDIKGVGHRRHAGVMNAERTETENVFDGAKHADGRVVIRDKRPMFYVRSDDKRDTPLTADVISAILRVVF